MVARLDRRNITVLAAFLCAVICGTALNFLAKRAALNEPPIALNAWRTLIAAGILLFPMIALGVRFRPTRRELAWYVVVAALAMAVPHALIFVALRDGNTAETTLAFAEAAVLGIVMVYLFASARRRELGTVAIVCAGLTLAGLAVFLGIRPQAVRVSYGDTLALLASVALGIGFIADARSRPTSTSGTPSLMDKCRDAVRKTFFTCLFSGAGTLLTLAALNAAGGRVQVPIPVPGSWPWIVVLAIVGSCLTWFSLFLLIALDKLALAAAVIAAVPITTEIANHFWFTPVVTTLSQWVGGGIVLSALSILISVQLATPLEKKVAPTAG